ncbi:hypothetical protein AX16_004406 [Volvariella volvacea WC 439]|nr:hypothetical protein AX16_004406 [Volvariella volvacea WC 439]
MTFNPQAHGTPFAQNSFSFDSPSFMDVTQETAVKIATLQAKLNQKLGPEFISQRPGPGGGPKLTYAEGWKIINLANEVFGFNGWSSSVVSLTTDFVDYNEQSQRYAVGVTAIMKVTLRDGVYHEDIGYGMLEGSKSKAAAIDKCKKEAVTDGLKRALRNFGNLLGNCLYDRAYTQEIVKIKIPPPKFDKSELYRRPEFEERPPVSNEAEPSTSDRPQPHQPQLVDTPTRPPNKGPGPLPAHIRAEMLAAVLANTKPQEELASSSAKGKEPAELVGLHTPVTPQVQIQRQQSMPPPAAPSAPAVAAALPVGPKNDPPPPAQPEPESDLMEVVEEGEESYPFNSEDDAFLATVDLDGVDLGRPIDFDEGIGVEESLGEVSIGDGRRDEGSPQPPSVTVQEEQGQNQKQETRKLASEDALAHGQHSDLSHPKIIPHQRRYLPQRVTGQQRVTGTETPPAGNAHTPKVVPSSPRSARSLGSGLKPSMGGFHFPPGVNPLHQAYKAPTGSSSGLTIGVKRPADTLNSGSLAGSFRKSAGLGMGLQQAAQGQSVDSDSKRLRR